MFSSSILPPEHGESTIIIHFIDESLMRPFHKDYGLPDSCRIRAAQHAQIYGVPAAAKMNRLGKTTVRQYCIRLEYQPLAIKPRRTK